MNYSDYLQALARRDQLVLVVAAIAASALLCILGIWIKHPGWKRWTRLALVGLFYLMFALAALGVLQ